MSKNRLAIPSDLRRCDIFLAMSLAATALRS
jgi:hypothetical protein